MDLQYKSHSFHTFSEFSASSSMKMMISVIGIIILHLLRHDKELQRKKIKPLYRELVIQNIGNSLSAESLLAEMFRQDRG